KCRLLPHTMATRSPAPTPPARSPPRARATSSTSSPYVVVRLPATTATASGSWPSRMCARLTCARFIKPPAGERTALQAQQGDGARDQDRREQQRQREGGGGT